MNRKQNVPTSVSTKVQLDPDGVLSRMELEHGVGTLGKAPRIPAKKKHGTPQGMPCLTEGSILQKRQKTTFRPNCMDLAGPAEKICPVEPRPMVVSGLSRLT